jgi:site-specific DNA-cytosine methylase
MGSFSEACRNGSIQVIAAFDQNRLANYVYEHNFGLRPSDSTLDSIQSRQIPDADIWWMSPPCTPYSVRGRQGDINDPRAKSLLRLVELVPEKRPAYILLENVHGFKESEARKFVIKELAKNGYKLSERRRCSTDFGVPMRRPRYFLTAWREESSDLLEPSWLEQAEGNSLLSVPLHPLRSFLDEQTDNELIMDKAEFEKYEAGLNLVDPRDAGVICICFTRNYYRCRTASGSLLLMKDGQVRRFSSSEILRLFGFSNQYKFPPDVTEEQSTSLLGNAVDVRMIGSLIKKKWLPVMGSHYQ